MWQPKKVERALFKWQKWRRSLIIQWAKTTNTFEELPLDQRNGVAKLEMQQIGFPSSLFLEIYWICCISSSYNLDYPTTYENIVIPPWLPLPPGRRPVRYYLKAPFGKKMKPGLRIHPPSVVGESDIDFFTYQDGYEAARFYRGIYYPKENDYWIFLSTDHPFRTVLNQLKGRPKLSGKSGRIPSYSDRLAVKCAALFDDSKMTYVKIAHKFGLPITSYYESSQSGTVRHLVSRGKKLIGELN
jgi:hypothetical protein